MAVNTIIVGISKISTALAIFAVLPIYTRYLSVGEYGLVDLVMVYSMLIVPLATLRLELALFRWLVDSRGDDKATGMVVSNVLRIVAWGVMVFSVVFWSLVTMLHVAYAPFIYVYMVLAVLFGIVTQAARGLGNIRIYAMAGIVNGALTAAVGAVLVAVYGMGMPGVLIGMIVGVLASIILVVGVMHMGRYFFRPKDIKLQREMIGFSLPMVPNGLSGWAIMSGTRVIVAGTLGMAANGIYAVAGRFTTLFSGVYDVFNITWTESAAMHINAKDRDVFFTKTINAALMFFGSAAITFIAVLPIVFPWFVDKSFSEAYQYIPFLAVGVLFDTAVRMIGALYVALRLTKQVMYTTMTAAGISLGGALLLIGSIGLWAPVISSCIAFLVMAIYRYIDIRKRGIDIVIRPTVVFSIIVGLAAVITTYYVQSIGLVGHLLVCSAAIIFAMIVNRDIMRLLATMRPSRKSKS